MRVRVVCGLSETIASLCPTMRFSSVDLPAFGRPTKETKPDFIAHHEGARDQGSTRGLAVERRRVAFAQQPLEIEPPREHRELAVGGPRPLLLRPIPIQLDAVLVGIAQVQRLADAVVRRAVERNARLQHSAKRVGELRARRIEDRRVIEAGGARRRRRAAKTLPGVQPDVVVIAAGGKKRRTRTVSLRQLEPETSR